MRDGNAHRPQNVIMIIDLTEIINFVTNF